MLHLLMFVGCMLIVVAAVAAMILQKRDLLTSALGATAADSDQDRRGEAIDFCCYEREQHLLSPAERSFYQALQLAVGTSFTIFGKVRIGDLVDVRVGTPRGKSQSLRNRIDRKHVDFVLCDPIALAPIIAIELNDRSHATVECRRTPRFAH